ncbi:MAG: hypothetical protein CMJ65_12445 [Planctomycetaceae bacterium]|nr:hypothetical protein [Planctomycetaceae bacterium]
MSLTRCGLPVLAATVLMLLCGCPDDDPTNPGSGSTTDPDVATTRAEPPLLPLDFELPEFRLIDQAGREFGSRELIGQPFVANFIFTRCPLTCPQQTRRMVAFQKLLKKRIATQHGSEERGGPKHFLWDKVRIVSISVDPKNDTPEALTRYADNYGADLAGWSFLTGKKAEIFSLITDGFRLPVEVVAEDQPILHSARVALVDHRGQLRGVFSGLKDTGSRRLLAGIEQVLNERVSIPPQIISPDWLESRGDDQRKAAKDWKVFHGFSFTDRQPESGIAFRHRVVDDAGRTYKAVHYDHGNGLAVADVDGDGRPDLFFSNQVGSNRLYRNLGAGKFEDITEAAGVGLKWSIGVTASFADIDNDGDADLYVTNIRTGNRLFENDGQGHFIDISAGSGLGHKGHSSSAIFFDYNRDGRLDLFLTNVGQYTRDRLRPVENDATDAGRETAAGPGRQGNGEPRFEFHDGMEDAFAGHLHISRTERSLLFRNEGGNRFVDVTESTGLIDESWTGAASPIDANDDGWIDLYVLNMQGNDEYYENVKGQSFRKRSRDLFPRTSWGAMGIKVFDFDNDGKLDIYITDMHSDMGGDHVEFLRDDVVVAEEQKKSPKPFADSILKTEGSSLFGNSFFRRTGPDRFVEVSDTIGAETYWPWGLSVGDLNADGFQDVFITSSMNFPWRYHPNHVLLNDAGKTFRLSEFVLGVEPRRDGRTAVPWHQLDASGRDSDHEFCEGREGVYTMYGSLGSRSSVILDLDGDGDLDIVTADFNTEPMVLVSDLAERTTVRFIKVRLIGSDSNRDGLGARVTVHAGGRRYVQAHDGQSGYLSQSRLPLYFGLGKSGSVEKIEVAWPAGTSQVVPGPIASGKLVEIEEPEGRE